MSNLNNFQRKIQTNMKFKLIYHLTLEINNKVQTHTAKSKDDILYTTRQRHFRYIHQHTTLITTHFIVIIII